MKAYTQPSRAGAESPHILVRVDSVHAVHSSLFNHMQQAPVWKPFHCCVFKICACSNSPTYYCNGIIRYHQTLNSSLSDALEPHPPIFHFQNHYRNIHLEGLLARQIHGRREARNPYNRRATSFGGTTPLLPGHLFSHFDAGETELVIAGSHTCTRNPLDQRGKSKLVRGGGINVHAITQSSFANPTSLWSLGVPRRSTTVINADLLIHLANRPDDAQGI